MRSATLVAEAPEWLAYDLPEGARGRFGGRYRGQTQKWFLFRFDGRGGGDRHPPSRRRRAQAGILGLALGALGGAARPRRAVQARGLRASRRLGSRRSRGLSGPA